MASPKTQPRFDAGFGTGKIQNDLPLGGAASLIIHGGFVLAALFTWQNTPRIMPEEVIAVDVVSDTPTGVGKNQSQETPMVGVETPTPSPIPQPLEPAPPSEILPAPAPLQQAPVPSAPSAAPPLASPLPPPPPTPLLPLSPPRAAPTPKPLPPPATRPTPPPSTSPQTQQAKVRPPTAAPARPATRARPDARTPPEFDLASASSAASGADSGGRRSPQLASKGAAGRQGRAGGGTVLTGDLEAALRAQIKDCWLEPADMSNPQSLIVEVNIELGIDGKLLRDPVLVTPSSRAGASNSLSVAIDNALRAVRQCEAYNLPPDRYETWRSVRFNFDPRRMMRR